MSARPLTPYQKVCARLDALGCLDGGGARLSERGGNVRCPAHDDQKASLSITEADDGRVLLHCFAGCSVEKIVAKLGLRMADLFRGPIAYDYVDLNGELRHQTLRYTPKAFKQRRPNGKGGWVWNLDGVQRVLYRLDEIQGQEEVGIPEGEKDVETLRELRLIGAVTWPATTNAMGAGNWRDEYAQELVTAGVKRVTVFADNDPAGETHALEVARSCFRAGLKVRILRLPGLPDKGDVSDWLQSHTAAEVVEVVEATAWLEEMPEEVEDAGAETDGEAPALTFPDAGMIGVAREFADLYAAHFESPRSFFYVAFLTVLGYLLSRMVTLDSGLPVQPRLYGVLLGESAVTRKSTAIREALRFSRELFVATFSGLGLAGRPHVLEGVGSAEGLAEELGGSMTPPEEPDKPTDDERQELEQKVRDFEMAREQAARLLLVFDEFKSFIDTARRDGSVALPMVTMLFESDSYSSRTKARKVEVEDASLSLLAACTVETYASMFDTRFHAIGFINRLLVVRDHAEPRFSLPRPIPDDARRELQARVRDLLNDVRKRFDANGGRPVRIRVTPEAQAMLDGWYFHERTGSVFESRLDTYAHRLMLLLAVTTGAWEVTPEVMQAVLAIIRYEFDVRRECDPVDAENTVARMEEKIRRTLARGPKRVSMVRRDTNARRYGHWVFTTALDNLCKDEEVRHDTRRGVLSLVTDGAQHESTSHR